MNLPIFKDIGVRPRKTGWLVFMTEFAVKNAQNIAEQSNGFSPKVGLVLGSGLGALAEQIQNPQHFPYDNLQGFNRVGVKGQSGTLTLGTLFGIPVACMQGRPHYYEGNDNIAMRTPIRTLKALGCEQLLITNAAASLRPGVTPGNLVVISDHINFSFHNPLVGPNDEEFGTRFPGMEDAYDPEMRKQLQAHAANLGFSLPDGVYIGVLGPSYETPAEIRAYEILGAHVVGMSTVPDVIIARHCGLKLAVISSITNMACGLSDEKLTHDNVLKVAKQASVNLIKLLQAYLEKLHAIA